MPINPPKPTPPVQQRATARARYELRRHTHAVEIAALGVALGVLLAIAVSPLWGLATVLIYTIGSAVTALAQGSK